MAFGFVVERFGLFLQITGREEIKVFQRDISFYIGVSFVLLAVIISIYSVVQHKQILKTLRPVEIPTSYNLRAGMILNSIIAVLGIAVSIYLTRGFS